MVAGAMIRRASKAMGSGKSSTSSQWKSAESGIDPANNDRD
jgi:hypothetical protein